MTDEIRNKILNCTTLPTLPAVALQILELAQNDEVDLNQIATRIKQDPALAVKILKTVNSSFYGRSNVVATVNHAVVLLGLQSVKTLVLGFTLVGNLTKSANKSFDHMSYWRRAIFAATATRVIARKISCVHEEEAFIATLLMDIGVLILETVYGQVYHEIYAQAKSHHDLAGLELKKIGTTHAEVAGMLATTWKLPPILVAPMGAHHAPASAGDPELVKLAQLVALGGRCGDVFVDDYAAPAIVDVREQMKTISEGQPVDADVVLAEIGEKTREAASLFEISMNGVEVDYSAIIKKANETLIEVTLRTQKQATQLAEQNVQLKLKATFDRLTGLANRAAFDEFFAEQYATAVQTGKPLSLVMLDVDKFKSVNDQHGHPTGDAVLMHIGGVLRSLAREGDMPARYGGEEMLMVLPDTTRAFAAHFAENLRKAIAAQPVSTSAGMISVTASFGVATLESGSPFKVPAHLLKAADLAVYKAKHSGRNNVKVFAPSVAVPKAA